MEIVKHSAEDSGLRVGQQINGCDVVKYLGGGAFGRVFSLFDRKANEVYVVKEVDLRKFPSRQQTLLTRENKMHRQLKHPNIIKFLDYTMDRHFLHLKMELATRYLEDEIDKGLNEPTCRRYFQDLISGVQYMHFVGMAHRDIKPDNLLIGSDGRLKIADFGLATEFIDDWGVVEFRGEWGTESYMAPEIFRRQRYHPEPADIWSCGIVLVVMLVNNLPWDVAKYDCPQYARWVDNQDYCDGPIDDVQWKPWQLIKKILHDDPRKRATIQDIQQHPWFLNTDFL